MGLDDCGEISQAAEYGRMRSRWVWAAGLLSATVSYVAAADAVSVSVSPSVAQEPAQITVRVTVEPNPDNRALEVIAESTDFFRKSHRQLDGDRASRISFFEYRGLPAGDYDVRVQLIDQEGSPQAVANAKVTIRP
jgi:hypothetical protein